MNEEYNDIIIKDEVFDPQKAFINSQKPYVLIKREEDAIKGDKLIIFRKSFQEIQLNIIKLHDKAMKEKKKRKLKNVGNRIQSNV
jgi:hypothetical protein